MIGPTPDPEARRCICCGAIVLTDENDPDYSEANAPYYIYPDDTVICSFKCFKEHRERARENAKATARPLEFGRW